MKPSDLRSKTEAELASVLNEKRVELTEKQRSLSAGELTNPHSITVLRKDIARVLTALKEIK